MRVPYYTLSKEVKALHLPWLEWQAVFPRVCNHYCKFYILLGSSFPDSSIKGVCFFLRVFLVCIHYSLWVSGLLGHLSELQDSRSKTREVTTLCS